MIRQRGFTLFEVVVVIVILSTLIAITSPVFIGAMQSVREIRAVSNLRQIYIAADIYRTDHDGQAIYGKASFMGLPDNLLIYVTKEPLESVLPGTKNLWSSPCGTHPSNAMLGNTDLSWAPDNDDSPGIAWVPYVTLSEESTVFVSDDNCSDHAFPLDAEFFTKKNIGVTLSGSIRKDIYKGVDTGVLYWSTH